MDIIKTENFLELPPSRCKTYPRAITIGNFDGCHLGHVKLLKQTLSLAKKLNLRSSILTFHPHPSSILKRSNKKQLFTLTQKLNFFKQLGFNDVIVQQFSNTFSLVTHQELYSLGLIKKLQTKAIIIGTDFCFGHLRQGTSSWLAEKSRQDHIQTHIMPKEQLNNKKISSTIIRKLVEENEIELANTMLNYPFRLEGHISKGEQKGRLLGFPTANITGIKQLLPGLGVYSGYTWIQEEESDSSPLTINNYTKKTYRSVINIGYKPTLITKNKKISVESHLFDNNFPLDYFYGKKAAFYFNHRIRNEMRFTRTTELKAQIKKDIDYAKKHLKRF